MQMRLKLGDNWGCLEVISVSDLEPGPYEGNIELKAYRLACDCGNTLTVDKTDWLGKQKTKDCGCGCADKPENVQVSMSSYIPLWMRVKLDAYARENRISRNKAVMDILSSALEAIGEKQ